ncbi:MAG: hypothetical protein M3Z07_03600 [Candidatus Eremiobacteraeota bacterium]|nr:hypothetical protein [Candidatus Eremiobacteraeota bacterium]
MRFLFLLVIVAAIGISMPVISSAQTAPAPEATEAPPAVPSPSPAPETPKVTKFAVQQFLAWQGGVVDRSFYSDSVLDALTDDVLNRGTATLARLGGLQKPTFRGISRAKGASFYVYHMACEHGSVNMEFALDPNGKIALIFFE